MFGDSKIAPTFIDWMSLALTVISLVVSLIAMKLASTLRDEANSASESAERSAGEASKAVETASGMATDVHWAADTVRRAVATAEQVAISTVRNLEISKRQGLIYLYQLWFNVKDIDPSNLIVADLYRGVKALEVTASFWNHDLLDKEILHQSFCEYYKSTFHKIIQIENVIPEINKSGRDLLKKQVIEAYEGMKTLESVSSVSGGNNQLHS